MRRILAVVATLSIAIGGYVHFRLWHGVYHHAPIREMFLLNVVLSAFFAIAVLIPRRIYALGGAALSAGSLIAIGLSRTVGLPTPHGLWTETGLAPAGQTLFGISDTLLVLIVETVALLTCVALVVVTESVRSGAGANGAAKGRRRSLVTA